MKPKKNTRRLSASIAGLIIGLLTAGSLGPWTVGIESLEDYILKSRLVLIGRSVEKSDEPVKIVKEDENTVIKSGIDETKFYSLKVEVGKLLKGEISAPYVELLYPVAKILKHRSREGEDTVVGGFPPYLYTELEQWGKERVWFLTESKVEAGFYKKVKIYSLSSLPLIQATLGILKLNETEQVAELTKWLASTDRTFVWTALDMLRRRKANAAVGPLISMFSVKDKKLLRKIYMTLVSINDNAGNLKLIEEMKSALKGKTDMAVFSITPVFMDRRVIPVLIEALGDPKCQVKDSIISKLGNFKAREAVAMLIPYLENADVSVRYNTYRALGEIGDPRALPHLEKALTRAPQRERETIEKAIREIKKQG